MEQVARIDGRLEPLPWQLDAACAGTDWQTWFPQAERAPVPAECAAVCSRCPVLAECAAFAREAGACGIWAGQRWLYGRPLPQDGETAAQACERVGVAARPAPRQVDRAAMIELHHKGLSNPQIAARLGVSRMTVWTALKALEPATV